MNIKDFPNLSVLIVRAIGVTITHWASALLSFQEHELKMLIN